MAVGENDYPGARFYKADLHVHTPESNCWRGPRDDNVLEQMFAAFKEHEIEVVAITDHNTVASVEEAKTIGARYGIQVFPGVEISTREGHVLAIFDPGKPTKEIDEWLIGIGLPESKRGQDNAVARDAEEKQYQISEVFSLIERQNGVAIAAHPNSDRGFLAIMKGTARMAAYASSSLRGLELGKHDPKKIMKLAQGKETKYPKRYGCIANSDAHSIEEIGKHFSYLKLGDFGIGALKQVFYDPSMRIRLAYQGVPDEHCWIESVEVNQGFFKGVPIRFHPDMNCLVGGKAVGKSLLVELIRFALDLKSPVEAVMEENESKIYHPTCLGDGGTVTLHVRANDGARYRIERTASDFDAGPEVYYADENTKVMIDVGKIFDCRAFSQNEITELGKYMPAILEWLDSFIDLQEDKQVIEDTKAEIKTVLEQLDEAHAVAIRIEALTQKKADLEAKKSLLATKVKHAALSTFPDWQKEERYLASLEESLARLREDTVVDLREMDVASYFDDIDDRTPNSRNIAKQAKALEALDADIEKAATTLEAAIDRKAASLRKYIEQWDVQFAEAKANYDKVVAETGVPNASALTSELNKAVRAIEGVGKELQETTAAIAQEKALKTRLQKTLMPAYSKSFSEVFKKRTLKAKEVTEGLDGFVRIEVRQMADRQAFEDALVTIARGSRLKKQELQQITTRVTPLELAELFAQDDAGQLAHDTGLPEKRAAMLLQRVWAECTDEDDNVCLSGLYDIALVELCDEITVELKGHDGRYKPMEELSVGSKCTAILSIALVDGQCPLIVDQPEDSLDNPFVFERIVKKVRSTKDTRQYIFATHNANVAVSSDAELIYCLQASALEGSVDQHGSIDHVATRDSVAANLEGGEDAFRLRGQKYDIVVKDPNAVVLRN